MLRPSDAGELQAVLSRRRNACGDLENVVVCGTVQCQAWILALLNLWELFCFGSRFEESRRTAKRPSSDRRDSYPEERKRVATERRYEGPGRFEDGSRYTSVLRYKDDSQIAVCSA